MTGQHWALIDPAGHSVELVHASQGRASAQKAWQRFTPLQIHRDAQAAAGWKVRTATVEDVESSCFPCECQVLEVPC